MNKNGSKSDATWAGAFQQLFGLFGRYQIPLITLAVVTGGVWAAWWFLQSSFMEIRNLQKEYSETVDRVHRSQLEMADIVLKIPKRVLDGTAYTMELVSDVEQKRKDAVKNFEKAEKEVARLTADSKKLSSKLVEINKERKESLSRLSDATAQLQAVKGELQQTISDRNLLNQRTETVTKQARVVADALIEIYSVHILW